MQRVFPSIDVALKKLAQRGTNPGGGGTVVIEHVEDLGGDTSVEPLDDGEIILNPLRIIWAGNTSGGHVRAKIAATEVKIKEVPPMIVVVGGEIKNNGDERANISYGVHERDWHSGD